jgi:sterol 3beta-glucosyltransferase
MAGGMWSPSIPMNITIVTVGSRGDVQPYVALGLALAARGHAVTVATHETFRTFVTCRGLGFAPVAGDPRGILAAVATDRWLGSGRRRHLIAAVRHLAWQMRPLADAMLADFWRVSRDADLVVYAALAMPCRHMGVPSVAAFLQPLHKTREHPMIRVLGARVDERLVEWLVWRTFRGTNVPAVYGFSPRVVPRPSDWPAGATVTGYWVLDPEPGWQPPAVLTDFLASGPPPVAIGFGSMTPRSASRLTKIAVDALCQSGQRGILLGGWGSFGDGALPDTIVAIDECPHEWLFPRTMAVVHHGGSGTTGAALRGGTPSIVVPLGFDQPFWASRVAALGVGPGTISRRGLTPAWLAAAIRRAVADQGMRSRASALGAALRAEQGAETAASILERR